ncbi:hypothetical protein BGZ51_005444 [Haplosporangium sp. Z 767]|nr:hypothetical protein BGZ51_005444 [Haplosporangium sp. Z 767]KAF9182296.1 hypothetical protein BGZ50_005000 [Haplosporangium sp. Z 11]
MRIPTIILLSSVALSILVHAEDVPGAGAKLDDVQVGPKVTANIDTSTTTSTDTKQDVNASGQEKTYPVGKGIVYTKTGIYVNDIKEGLQNLLGINIEIGGNGEKNKKNRDHDDGDQSKEGDKAAWRYQPLYGDDGYVKRPVPQGCAELSFKDQMVWDQQGNHDQSGPSPHNSLPLNGQPPVPMSDIETPDVTVQAPSVAAPPTAGNVAAAGDVSANGDVSATGDVSAAEDASAAPEMASLENANSNVITDTEMEDNQRKIEPKGIRICLLGICIGDDDGDDEDEDKGKQKSKRIHHKQKKFLEQFRGKALKIDAHTGCPLPSRD